MNIIVNNNNKQTINFNNIVEQLNNVTEVLQGSSSGSLSDLQLQNINKKLLEITQNLDTFKVDVEKYIDEEELKLKTDSIENIIQSKVSVTEYTNKVQDIMRNISDINVSIQNLNNAISNIGNNGGNVDLSNYYTKIETINEMTKLLDNKAVEIENNVITKVNKLNIDEIKRELNLKDYTTDINDINTKISQIETTISNLPSTPGTNGQDGQDGKSAYELAVENGYNDTVVEWLKTLKGEKGDKGEKGEKGETGLQGVKGETGLSGTNGLDGKSAYQLWLEANNYIETDHPLSEFLNLKGTPVDYQDVKDKIEKNINDIKALNKNISYISSDKIGQDITQDLQELLNNDNVKTIELPSGIFIITSLNLDKASGKILKGQGLTTILNVDKSVNSPAMLSTSVGTLKGLELKNFTVDMQYTSGDFSKNALQFTNSSDIIIDSIKILNSGNQGILLQGFNGSLSDPKGTSDVIIKNCIIDGTGLSDGTTGFGILVKDNSLRVQILGNRIVNIKGGMGIGGQSTTQGSPVGLLISNNTIEMVQSSTAFEGIGLTAGCDEAVIVGNRINKSYDNGISASANRITVTGNTINHVWNHGIALEGKGATVVGNTINTVGLQNSALGESIDYGAITLQNPANCTVVGNTALGDDYAYGIKINGTSDGTNYIGLNSIKGFTKGLTFNIHTNDIVIQEKPITSAEVDNKIAIATKKPNKVKWVRLPDNGEFTISQESNYYLSNTYVDTDNTNNKLKVIKGGKIGDIITVRLVKNIEIIHDINNLRLLDNKSILKTDSILMDGNKFITFIALTDQTDTKNSIWLELDRSWGYYPTDELNSIKTKLNKTKTLFEGSFKFNLNNISNFLNNPYFSFKDDKKAINYSKLITPDLQYDFISITISSTNFNGIDPSLYNSSINEYNYRTFIIPKNHKQFINRKMSNIEGGYYLYFEDNLKDISIITNEYSMFVDFEIKNITVF